MTVEIPYRQLVAPYSRPMAPLATEMTPGGSLNPPIRCLLCDIYGTLFISNSGGVNIARQQPKPKNDLADLLQRYNISLSPDALLEKLYDAIEKEHQKSKDKGVAFPEVRLETIWKRLLCFEDENRLVDFAIEFEMVVNPTWPMPHLNRLLSTCRDKNIKLGLISNAQFFTPYLFGWYLERSIEQSGFDTDLCLFSFTFGEAKPSPRLFETAAQRLASKKIPPHQTAYIGNDVAKDIVPANRVGFQTILFAGDARSLRTDIPAQQSKDATPDLVVTDLQQLISYL